LTKRIDTPIRRTNRSLSRIHRAIVPMRKSGGASVIAIPKSIREALEAELGDRFSVEFNPEAQRVEISKDTESNRERALYQSSNLDIIGDRIRDAHMADNSSQWESRIEKVLWGMLNHLKGDKLDRPDNDDDGEEL